MSESVPLGITELLQRVGDDNVRVQNVIESMVGIKIVGKGRKRHTQITFATDAITPSDVLYDQYPQQVGLVVWIPRRFVQQALAEHRARLADGGSSAR